MAPLQRRVMLMVARAIVRTVGDGDKMQVMQLALLRDELRDRVERFQEYGFTSHPHPGAEAVAVFVGGDRGHGLVVAVDDRRYRLTGLAQGEVALYDDLGNVVALRRDKIEVVAVQHAEVTAPTMHVTATTTHDGSVTINGNLAVNGSIAATGQVADGAGTMQGMRDVYNGHDHTGDDGGTTSTPHQQMM